VERFVSSNGLYFGEITDPTALFPKCRGRLPRRVPSTMNEDDVRLFRGILTGVVITAWGGAITWLAVLVVS
jgi:hypothetical protein